MTKKWISDQECFYEYCDPAHVHDAACRTDEKGRRYRLVGRFFGAEQYRDLIVAAVNLYLSQTDLFERVTADLREAKQRIAEGLEQL